MIEKKVFFHSFFHGFLKKIFFPKRVFFDKGFFFIKGFSFVSKKKGAFSKRLVCFCVKRDCFFSKGIGFEFFEKIFSFFQMFLVFFCKTRFFFFQNGFVSHICFFLFFQRSLFFSKIFHFKGFFQMVCKQRVLIVFFEFFQDRNKFSFSF